MSSTDDAPYEGIVIRLKEFFSVDTDEELSKAADYSLSSISTWRHKGMSQRTAKTLAKQHEGLTVDYILYGDLVEDINLSGVSLISNDLMAGLQTERLLYCLAYITTELKDASLTEVFETLFLIDEENLLNKNKSITSLVYDKTTKLPFLFINQVFNDGKRYSISFDKNLSLHKLNVTLNDKQSITFNSQDWRKLFSSHEIQAIEKFVSSKRS